MRVCSEDNEGRLLHHFASRSENLALFFRQCVKALRGDLIEDRIDLATDEGAWFVTCFRGAPGHMSGERARLLVRAPSKRPRAPVYEPFPKGTLSHVRDAQEQAAQMRTMRYVIKRD